MQHPCPSAIIDKRERREMATERKFKRGGRVRPMKRLFYIVAAALAVMATDTTEAADKAAAFLKTVEGFRATAYSDAAGKSTIGYGFTSTAMIGRGRITETEASTELSRLCRSISARLRAELGSQKLTVAEESAVVSFIYNVGWGNFRTSTMCRMLKEGKRGWVVADEFARWVYVTKGGRKVVCNGLKRRREKERRRFMGRC